MVKLKLLFLIPAVSLMLTQCKNQEIKKASPDGKNINDEYVMQVEKALADTFGIAFKPFIKKGIKQTASLWRTGDGSPEEFMAFCKENFITDPAEKESVFNTVSKNLESLWGHQNKISLDLNENIQLNKGDYGKIDEMFAAYSPSAHFEEDFYNNKIAFVIALNFPSYSLDEKNELGKKWSNLEWAYSRMGDVFTARVPSALAQKITDAETEAEIYISEYNIYMGKLLNKDRKKLFPDDMVLLSHWNLRDELKSDYADKENGPEKQEMIYSVMKHIINQTIPQKVVNSDDYDWYPLENKTYQDGKEVKLDREPDTRYLKILNNFNAQKATDDYYTEYNTFIKRSFSDDKEIPQEDVEKLFDAYLSSPVVKDVGKLISKRLGRNLKPYDIWYDGFKARSSISGETLDNMTQTKYPDTKAFQSDLGNILKKLGWAKERAEFIASKVTVDPARGSGHAWGAEMRSENAHLRTRISEKGMDYKGYNIAVHEFGHNVEQTISLHNTPFYMMNGVPNTAFTEALAFIFQKRDLMLLGVKDENPDKKYLETLDAYWSVFEIMGVSMVDMKVWKWLYENPNATAADLNAATVRIAKEVWNKYFAEVFGTKDEPILAIYSHMVNSPLYLANYSFGHLIDFQIEQFLVGKNFSQEVDRIWSIGRLTPQVWMQKAVGEDISTEPMINATKEALKYIK
jgi:hypothetical protein